MKAQAIRNRSLAAYKLRILATIANAVSSEVAHGILAGALVFGLVYSSVVFGIPPLN